jgi:hypothetical protein
MQWSLYIKIAGVGVIALGLCAQPPAPVNENAGLPPRAAPSDYQKQVKAGAVTIAAEFAGHGVPTPEGALSTEDYVVVEAAFYGPPEARLRLSFSNFSLRINGKKAPTPAEYYERVVRSVKDPDWTPPEKPEKQSSFNTGGGGGAGDSAPLPPKVPPELQRAWTQRVKKASLTEGDRPLPQAGLLYFSYGGKVKSIRSVELIYSGPAGNATLELER